MKARIAHLADTVAWVWWALRWSTLAGLFIYVTAMAAAKEYGPWAGIAVATAYLAVVAAFITRWSAQRPQPKPVRSETEVRR